LIKEEKSPKETNSPKKTESPKDEQSPKEEKSSKEKKPLLPNSTKALQKVLQPMNQSKNKNKIN
jgi:hypothetical protein